MWVIRQKFERRCLTTGQVTITCQNWSEKHNFWVDAQKELMSVQIGYERRGEILFRGWDSRPVCGTVTREWLYISRPLPHREWKV
jgi:hypothetical protein